MKKDSGEIVIGALVGLAVGAVALWITADNWAQQKANETGIATAPVEMLGAKPGKSALVVLGPAAAGAGIGWALDQSSDDSAPNQTSSISINIDGERNSVTISDTGRDSTTGTDQSNTEGF